MFNASFIVKPIFILVFYRRFLNCLGLVTYCLSTVYIVVLIMALSCIGIKFLNSRYCLISYLSHFSPSRVNTKFEMETLVTDEPVHTYEPKEYVMYERLRVNGWQRLWGEKGRYARCVFTDDFMFREFGPRYIYLQEANGEHTLDTNRDRVIGIPYYQPYSYDLQLAIPRRVSVVDPRINNRYMSSICHYYKGYRSLQLLARMVSVLELVGTAIRPISLSLRLVANMSCRHILMALFSGRAPFLFFCSFPCVFVCGLETLVCFVQCYVFYTLWCMYMEE